MKCVKKAFADSKNTKDLKLHRTKCSEIIKNALGPHFKKTLLTDIGSSKFSLIIDESTDITVHKYLGIVIRYYSSKQRNIVSTFFALIELETSDARGIVNALVNAVVDMGLNLKNLVGLGTDNASVMTGLNNGVYTILKQEFNLPHLVLVRCLCHSLQLAVAHASEETIPRNIEFLLRETYNWFSLSPQRRQEYSKIYETINCGKQPLKILQKCATRWLSIEPAVQRILNQWDELKLLFQVSRSKNNCYTAQLLYEMYSDNKNKVYLHYIKNVLTEIQFALKAFEGENADPTRLLEALINLLESLSSKVILSTRRHSIDILTINNIEDYLDPASYLSYNFEKSLEPFSDLDKNNLRKRCVNFTIKLIKELQERLPKNVHILKKKYILSVTETLKTNKGLEIIELAESFGICGDDIDKIVGQWRNIPLETWIFTKDTTKFWTEVKEYKDAGGNNPFQELSELALHVLVLPHSNADVERIFSQMNVIKSKLRNRMNLNTLNSILYIRTGLKTFNSTCYSYDIPKEVTKKVGSKDVYTFKLTQQNPISTVQAGPSTSTQQESQEIVQQEQDSDDDDWLINL